MMVPRTAGRIASGQMVNNLASVADAQRQQWGVNQTTQGVHKPVMPVLPDLADESTYRHFTVVKVSDTSVKILAGPVNRFAGGLHTKIGLTIDGGGTSIALADAKTLTGITATTHIVIDLDDPLEPTTCTASSTGSATYPTGDTTYVRRVLALVTCASGIITNIEQYEDGAWTDPFAIFDGLSLNYDTDLLAQVYGWATQAVDAAPAETVEVLWRAAQGDVAGYSQLISILQAISDWTGVDLDGATGPWDDITHATLPDIFAETAGDDHDGTIDGLGYVGNYPYLSNVGDKMRNACLYGFGDSGGNASIGATDRELYGSDELARLAWDDCQAFDPDGFLTLDWYARELTQGPWAVTDTTVADGAAGGALAVAGGIDVAENVWALGGFEIDADNYWQSTGLNMDIAGDVAIGASGDLNLAAATWGINGDPYALVEIIAPIAAGGPLHSLTVLARDNGVI